MYHLVKNVPSPITTEIQKNENAYANEIIGSIITI